MVELTLDVKGMSCGHCKNSVEGALNDLIGVKSAVVDLDEALVTVKFDDVQLEKNDLETAIEDAGPYEVK
jgi:copper chaperone